MNPAGPSLKWSMKWWRIFWSNTVAESIASLRCRRPCPFAFSVFFGEIINRGNGSTSGSQPDQYCCQTKDAATCFHEGVNLFFSHIQPNIIAKWFLGAVLLAPAELLSIFSFYILHSSAVFSFILFCLLFSIQPPHPGRFWNPCHCIRDNLPRIKEIGSHP